MNTILVTTDFSVRSKAGESIYNAEDLLQVSQIVGASTNGNHSLGTLCSTCKEYNFFERICKCKHLKCGDLRSTRTNPTHIKLSETILLVEDDINKKNQNGSLVLRDSLEQMLADL